VAHKIQKIIFMQADFFKTFIEISGPPASFPSFFRREFFPKLILHSLWCKISKGDFCLLLFVP